MNPVLVIAIPLGLIILGMILNSLDLGFDQPPSSPERDPVKQLAAERETYAQLFDRQRSRAVKRQKRVSQYGRLLVAAVMCAFIGWYLHTVSTTSLSSRTAPRH